MTGVQPARLPRNAVRPFFLSRPGSPCLCLALPFPAYASSCLASPCLGPPPSWNRNPSAAASCFWTLEGRPIALKQTRWHAQQKPRIPCRLASFLRAHRQTNVIRLTTTGTTAAAESPLERRAGSPVVAGGALGSPVHLTGSQGRRRAPRCGKRVSARLDDACDITGAWPVLLSRCNAIHHGNTHHYDAPRT